VSRTVVESRVTDSIVYAGFYGVRSREVTTGQMPI
jgi:hypothetical protein